MRLIIEAAARADIDRTVNWYNEQDAGLGTLFLDALSSRMERIVTNPRIFPLRRGGEARPSGSFHIRFISNRPKTRFK